ncbi:hypothetical protein CCYA_CCYA20G4789 [Cyanidiococcus yangmingshanensis]|nr:hypothetical protein CCYA_CCYA20G4789 [Cyanidiococcus yangmingshanensis]
MTDSRQNHGLGGPKTATSSAVLYAAAKEIGTQCREQNRSFLQCKATEPDPANCLDKGRSVQRCVLELLMSLNATCPSQFEAYARCLGEQSAASYAFERCRRLETALVECRQAQSSQRSRPDSE